MNQLDTWQKRHEKLWRFRVFFCRNSSGFAIRAEQTSVKVGCNDPDPEAWFVSSALLDHIGTVTFLTTELSMNELDTWQKGQGKLRRFPPKKSSKSRSLKKLYFEAIFEIFKICPSQFSWFGGPFWVPVGPFFDVFLGLQFCTHFLSFFSEKNEKSKKWRSRFRIVIYSVLWGSPV